MSVGEPRFWMQGKSATTLIELSDDPSALDDGGFWAVSVDYEGNWRCAKFADIYDDPFPPTTRWRSEDSDWESSLSREEYIQYVERIKTRISQGDIYQCNACRVISRPNSEPLEGLFQDLIEKNPSPYAAFFKIPGVEIASASPELFMEITNRNEERAVKSSPIKGTSKSPVFLEKDSPENIMIVDLMRNDLGSICEVGSVQTPRLLEVEPHPGLFHLVSDVTGTIRSEIGWREIAERMLPAGSISGAPKSSAVKLIAENERYRGPYTGLIGWVHGKEALLAVAIRTFWQADQRLHFGTGAGITWGSDPVSEWEETELKASRLIAIADCKFAS